MRTILRYLLIWGTLVLTVWLVFGYQIGNRSIYSHLLMLREGPVTNILGQFRSEFESSKRLKPVQTAKVKAKPTAPSAKMARRIQDRRVKKLKMAAKKANLVQKRKRPSPTVNRTEKTKIDDRISTEDEKALDELLTARLDRLK